MCNNPEELSKNLPLVLNFWNRDVFALESKKG